MEEMYYIEVLLFYGYFMIGVVNFYLKFVVVYFEVGSGDGNQGDMLMLFFNKLFFKMNIIFLRGNFFNC